ncbi:helix-turn-helix transcriptional regulator [Mucilaginibacter aquariorum]|uniref:WYL domain-containing protein n=1 Tax=Mucilaginibacter aquariorum TaxID=2967225 RepID=A0ABT1T729_9SPHI|nr:WYL domain-containing protein [Mucilaginibacter aquariorum]MCQ6960402.1 WYL domain-containing protein [Mucilaginibacter aquariorum]
MTTQKSAYRRYATIDRCLNDPRKKYWTKKELIEEIRKIDIEIKPRTFDGDIYDMRYETGLTFQNAPIGTKRNKGFYYERPFSITLPIDAEDIHQLEVVAQTLTQYQNTAYFNQFGSVIDKVIRIVKQVKESNSPISRSFILFEKIPRLVGYQLLDPILTAVEQKQVLAVTYQKFNEAAPFTVNVHPYFVKEFRNRWYLVGLYKTRLGTYGLDRIKAVEPVAIEFIENTLAVPEDYFKDCIGIDTRSPAIEKVILEFTPQQSHYIRTQDIHRSQNITRDDENGICVELDLMINQELIMQILSYGEHVKVIAPEVLVTKVREAITLMAHLYS